MATADRTAVAKSAADRGDAFALEDRGTAVSRNHGDRILFPERARQDRAVGADEEGAAGKGAPVAAFEERTPPPAGPVDAGSEEPEFPADLAEDGVIGVRLLAQRGVGAEADSEVGGGSSRRPQVAHDRFRVVGFEDLAAVVDTHRRCDETDVELGCTETFGKLGKGLEFRPVRPHPDEGDAEAGEGRAGSGLGVPKQLEFLVEAVPRRAAADALIGFPGWFRQSTRPPS